MRTQCLPDGMYLDVFTCNEPEVNESSRFSQSRKHTLAGRTRMFSLLHSYGLIPSSEEVGEWALNAIETCHYAPYHAQLQGEEKPLSGIPIPLFSLIYHNTVVIPWIMDTDTRFSHKTFCALNAGAPYFLREGAYPNTDGAFAAQNTPKETMGTYRELAETQRKLADENMVAFSYLPEDWNYQMSVFSSEDAVLVHLGSGKYRYTKCANTEDMQQILKRWKEECEE